jgi:hypothetical protein
MVLFLTSFEFLTKSLSDGSKKSIPLNYWYEADYRRICHNGLVWIDQTRYLDQLLGNMTHDNQLFPGEYVLYTHFTAEDGKQYDLVYEIDSGYFDGMPSIETGIDCYGDVIPYEVIGQIPTVVPPPQFQGIPSLMTDMPPELLYYVNTGQSSYNAPISRNIQDSTGRIYQIEGHGGHTRTLERGPSPTSDPIDKPRQQALLPSKLKKPLQSRMSSLSFSEENGFRISLLPTWREFLDSS